MHAHMIRPLQQAYALLCEGVMQVTTGMPDVVMLSTSYDVVRTACKMLQTHLEGFNKGRQEGVIGGPCPKLPVLVPPKGEQVACVCHSECVRVPACYFDNVAAAECLNALWYEDIIAVSMTKPTKIPPALTCRRCEQPAMMPMTCILCRSAESTPCM